MVLIHTVIGGFTQRRNCWHGMLELNEKLIEEIGNGINTRVWFQRWCTNWKVIAEHVWLIGQKHEEEVQVCIYAYSWGAGWGAMQFAKHLNRSNITVRVMVLSDPVYRHPRLMLRWLSMIPGMEIRVPVNVKEVFNYHQTKNRPMGHDLRGVKKRGNLGKTVFHPWIELNYIHQKMDSAPEFYGRCLEQARIVEEESKNDT